MDRIVLVSYPRSGSNYLLGHIKLNSKKITICYGSCGKVPCQCENPAVLRKYHDFNSKTKIYPKVKYICLLRKNKLENIESFCRNLFLQRQCNKLTKRENPNT